MEYSGSNPVPARDGGTAEARWNALNLFREPFLLRAYDCAALTIPSILPPRGYNGTSKLPQPYQGLGARGTTNLANRITMALLPAGSNHFRMDVPAKMLAKMKQLEVPEELNQQFAILENLIQSEVDSLNWRQATNLVAQHLIVTGNLFEYEQPDGNLRNYRLDCFVVVRDCYGTMTEFITREDFSADSLPDNLRAIVASEKKAGGTGREYPLYTWGERSGDGSWKVHQEICTYPVTGTDGKYAANATLPFWHLRWSAVLGEDYGRGKVEEHLADLITLDGLTKALREGAAMASRNITLIRPNAAGGVNLRKRLAQANNGDFVIGVEDDVKMLQFQNVNGMQFVAQQVERLEQNLGASFMLGSAMRRDAERVTATELRQMAEELDGALGGIYSILSQEMALPRLERLIMQMQAQQELPQWPDGMVNPVVLTGLEALGRERDVQRIGTALQLLQGIPQEIIAAYPKWDKLIDRGFVAVGLPEMVNTQQEVEAQQKQQALIQALQNAAPTVAGKMLPSADAQAQQQQPGAPQPTGQ